MYQYSFTHSAHPHTNASPNVPTQAEADVGRRMQAKTFRHVPKHKLASMHTCPRTYRHRHVCVLTDTGMSAFSHTQTCQHTHITDTGVSALTACCNCFMLLRLFLACCHSFLLLASTDTGIGLGTGWRTLLEVLKRGAGDASAPVVVRTMAALALPVGALYSTPDDGSKAAGHG